MGMLRCAILLDVYEENSASHRHMGGKWRDSLKVFKHNFGYSLMCQVWKVIVS